MNEDNPRLFGLTLAEINTSLGAMGQPAMTPLDLGGYVASGLIHISPESRRAQEQWQKLNSLSEKQHRRLSAYMDQGLDFDAAYVAVRHTDPVIEVNAGLATLNLPPVRAPRGRKLTRRQRRKT